MQYINNCIDSYYSLKKTAVTLGKFDGLHLGHQLLINKIRDYSNQETNSVVFSFDMHRKALLTQKEQHHHLTGQVDVLIRCPFTQDVREMEPETFVKEILVKHLKASHVVVGEDFRFGHNKRGDATLLGSYASTYGYTLDVLHKVELNDETVSSSRIKDALSNGEMEVANEMLGYTYEISGIVETGRRLGRTLGFPTINISPPIDKFTPKAGVYFAEVELRGESHFAVCGLGYNPTVTDDAKLIAEAHVFDFNQVVYGNEASIKFISFIRPEMKFNTLDELKNQVDLDIEKAKQMSLNY